MNATAAFDKFMRTNFPNAGLPQRVELRAVFMAGRRSHQREVALLKEIKRKKRGRFAAGAAPLTRSE